MPLGRSQLALGHLVIAGDVRDGFSGVNSIGDDAGLHSDAPYDWTSERDASIDRNRAIRLQRLV